MMITAKNTSCQVVELTEREHVILSRVEKSQKSITKLSRSTRKNHGVQIFLMKQLHEVHIRGTNYHQGLQELLKEIKRATEWWESHRSATDSDDRCSKAIINEPDSRPPSGPKFQFLGGQSFDHFLLDPENGTAFMRERLRRILDEMSERSYLRTFNPANNLHVPVRR